MPKTTETNANPAAKPYSGAPSEVKKSGTERLYREEDKAYISYLQKRLERAKEQRNSPYPEFNNKSYIQVYEENEKIANTWLPAKKNDDDVIVASGTIESKLDTLLSHLANLDLSFEVEAYEKENNKIHEIGVALQDIIFMTEMRDGGDEGGDEEKKILRQRELLKQGTVFVQEEWLRLWETKKKLKKNYNGEFKDWSTDAWEESYELIFDGPSRTLLHGPNVYLGDITQFFQDKQPYLFVAIHENYHTAKAKYGKFENWDYVVAGKIPDGVPTEQRSIFDNKWRLTAVKDENVEIILYQDKPHDQFQIIINGVLMLPIGFPLSAVCPGGNYNIAKQTYRVINSNFAYGKSFVGSGSIKEMSAILDEMLKLFVLKTRKSITPPYVNTSGKVISSKVLSPGRITMGIPPDALQAIGQESQGVNANEYQVFKEIQDRIDKQTVSNQFQGQQGKSGTTATEVVELQRQAKLTLGLTIIAAALLEKKLGYLRLWNILANWFDPIDTKFVLIDGARKEMAQYRNTYRSTNIDGEGTGARQVLPTDEAVPSPEAIRELELIESKDQGMPIRKIYINAPGLKQAKLTWYGNVNPREKETSAFHKLLFREMLTDIMTLMQLGSVPNVGGLEEEFGRIYQKNRSKLFSEGAGAVRPEMAGVSGAVTGAPRTPTPTPMSTT